MKKMSPEQMAKLIAAANLFQRAWTLLKKYRGVVISLFILFIGILWRLFSRWREFAMLSCDSENQLHYCNALLDVKRADNVCYEAYWQFCLRTEYIQLWISLILQTDILLFLLALWNLIWHGFRDFTPSQSTIPQHKLSQQQKSNPEKTSVIARKLKLLWGKTSQAQQM